MNTSNGVETITAAATVALACATFIAVLVALWQGRQARLAAERGYRFEYVRQIPLVAPMVVATIEPRSAQASDRSIFRLPDHLTITNAGFGTACNVHISYIYGSPVSAAQNTLPPIRAGQSLDVAALDNQTERSETHRVRIWYDDVFDNRYITEYRRLSAESRYYVWRRPWVGREFGLSRPQYCSDELSWDLEGHETIFVDQSGTEWETPLGSGRRDSSHAGDMGFDSGLGLSRTDTV